MKKRIRDKIEEIERYLGELLDFVPANFEEYMGDVKAKSACERHFEKIVEAVVDLALLAVKRLKLPLPENNIGSFDILVIKNVITKELAEKLKDAKKMRNVVVHEYGEIDDELVFEAISEKLEKEVTEFITQVKKYLKF